MLPEEVEVSSDPREGYAVQEEGEILVALDVVVTDELRGEGLARDIVRRIQDQRKKAGFDISDQIEIYYRAPPKLEDVIVTHEKYIASETLAAKIVNAEIPSMCYTATYSLQGENVAIGILRLNRN